MNRQVFESGLAVFFFLLSPLTPAFAYDAGNCLDFDGINDYAASGGFSTSLTNITLEAWVYHRTVPASIQRYVYLQGSGSNDVAVIRHDGVAQQGRLHFYIRTDDTYRHIRVDGALQPGKWYHVAGAWDGTTQRLYLDGEEVGTNTPGGSLDAPDGYVILSNTSETMDGYLDEVRIWNDARTADEIRSNMYRSLSGSESGLEGYWKLNETSGSTAYDSAGSVDLDLYNMTSDDWVTSGAFSGPRNALDFDGTEDYVSIPSNTSLDNSQFSTEFWVKMDSPGNWDGIIDKGRSTNSDWYFLTRTSALGEGVVFSIRTASSLATLPYSWSDASWHHVAGTYDGTNMILYVDGVQRGSCTASMIVTTNNIRIGSRRNGTYHFEGKLDEVHIWDDVRTASEIQEHMCKTMEGDESNLVAYWRFDQAAGTTLYDLTSNDNDGTLTNMTDDDWVASEAFTTWIGYAGTDWATAANWSLGAVPNSISTNVGIPIYSGGNEPTMAGDYTCNHLSITSGATYTINSSWTLTVNGNSFSSGIQAGDGLVEFTGASATHWIAGTFENVELNESAGAELAGDATINGALTLTAGAFSIVTNTLTLNGLITVGSGGLSGGSSSDIVFGGSGANTDLPAVDLNNLTVNRANGIGLSGGITIEGTLALTNGDLDLSGYTVTLGTNGILSESEGNTIKGASGVITTTRTFNAGDLSAGVNIAGMGAEITTDADLGSTVITRGHSVQTDAGEESILRYYDINPTNNSGLDAAFVFCYYDSELNGITESDLGLYRSADLGGTWSARGGTVDTDSETIILNGLDAFSRWTAFELSISFTNAVSLTGVYECSVAWGDYDNDGDLDVLLAGWTGSSRITRIYSNEGSGTFTDIGAGLPGLEKSSVAWGDYDNDGDLDVLLAGRGPGTGRITRIYRNDGSGVFTDIGAGLPGVEDCGMAWGDYDNDGDLDVLLAGSRWPGGGYITRIYRNEASDTFTDIGAGLPGEYDCMVAWGDYDNDGDLDVLLAGYDDSNYITRIYRNDGSGIFTDIGAGLTGVFQCSVAWGDYDNDGDLDVLLAGWSGSGPITRIYRNEGSGTFSNIGAGLTGVSSCSVAWGDYDNDGDLDVLIAGSVGGSYITRIYRNGGSGTFTDIGAELPDVQKCSVAWGDYDSDGDLDVLMAGDTGGGYITRIYRNDNPLGNAVPNAPTNLTAVGSGQDVALSWDKATDVETDQNALTYNLRIGTSSVGVDIVSPMADIGTGYRRIPALGNTNHDSTWVIRDLPVGVYYWNVQAIDNAFAGSAFAPIDSFYCFGADMMLTGVVQLDTLVLEWSTVPLAASYWVYGALNEPYFDPQVESPFGHRLTVTPDTTWSSPAGIADPDTNWTYQVIAVDGWDRELGRTNRFGEHEFELP